jgi:hypothetical protein
MSRTFRIVLFSGPSRPAVEPSANLEFRPPARRGDISRLKQEPNTAALLIDGAFLHEPAVTHLELLDFINSGRILIGAASVGALRAAELRSYGMIGVGCIFHHLLSQSITDDSELAVAMCPYSFAALSVPIVNIRRCLALAVDLGLSRQIADRALDAALDIYFLDRTIRKLEAEWLKHVPEYARELIEIQNRPATDIKKADARMAILHSLSMIEDDSMVPRPAPFGETVALYSRRGGYDVQGQ